LPTRVSAKIISWPEHVSSAKDFGTEKKEMDGVQNGESNNCGSYFDSETSIINSLS
jgi:hypothetical protein